MSLKKSAYILFVLGLTLFIGIIIYFGIEDVFNALRLAGLLGLSLVSISHIAPLYLDSLAWKLLFTRSNPPPGLGVLIKARWIGESINSLLPAVQIGGDLVRARMLASRGYPVSESGASVLVEITIALITQLFFSIFGIGGLIYLGHKGLVKEAIIATVLLSLGALGFFLVQQKGLWTRLLNLLSLLVSKEKLKGMTMDAEALDQAILELYKKRWIIIKSSFWRLVGWFSGSLEVWIALKFMGTGKGIFVAILIESLCQVIRGMVFFVPGAYGIQEGGFVLLGKILGLPPDIALGLSLAKRFRELTLGIPGLIFWQIEEGKILFKDRRKENEKN